MAKAPSKKARGAGSKAAAAGRGGGKATSRTYRVKIRGDDEGGSAMSAIPVPFDPREVFGKARAPVRVTVNGYTFRSTVFTMCGEVFVPLRTSNREAARVARGETHEVTLTLDETPREVEVPEAMRAALKKAGAWAKFEAMSFTHRREWVEAVRDAKKEETRARRLAQCIAAVSKRVAKR